MRMLKISFSILGICIGTILIFSGLSLIINSDPWGLARAFGLISIIIGGVFLYIWIIVIKNAKR
jgi:hypothetical protein